ncbi:MFS transporter [Bradyrhizobium sp. LCT2]|uniref:MFS transporter n=1 Tax=Bradyrhizobium sp. LCT2 TaxID=2493093 RepID=UPI00137528F0|nr:MFS transporter [Bradyrhizobium sp. LCT2]
MRMVSPRTSALHYGWIVLGAGTFGSFMTLPGQTAGVSVFFDPITADLGISRTPASIAYAMGTLAGILPAPVIGRWIDRRGPRLTATIIAGGLALACTLMAAVQTAMMLLIGFALLRGAAIGGLSLVSQQVVNLWFVRRRGIAAAAASLGLAAGSMTFPKLIDSLISLYGWRGAYLALAGLVALTILPVAAALFRDRPEKYGLSTDAGLPPTMQDLREEPSFTRKQALRTGVFWLLCAAGFLTNAIGTALLLNHFSIMRTAGIAHSDALLLLSLLAGVQAVATLGTGFLVDRHEPRHLVPLAMFMLALATALPALSSGVAISVLYALSLGGAYGSQQAINAAGYAQYFGRDHLGAIRGASFVFGIAGAAFGPLPFAASVDWAGSYAAVLIGCCMLCIICGAGAFAVKRPFSSAESMMNCKMGATP